MKTANDPQQSNAAAPAETPTPSGDRGLYRDVIELAKSLAYRKLVNAVADDVMSTEKPTPRVGSMRLQ